LLGAEYFKAEVAFKTEDAARRAFSDVRHLGEGKTAMGQVFDAMKVPERDVTAAPKALPESTVPTKAQALSNQAGSSVPQRPFGPGAANVGDVPVESQMRQLTEAVRSATSPKQPLSERLTSRGVSQTAQALPRTR
jgi:hypothetical protein